MTTSLRARAERGLRSYARFAADQTWAAPYVGPDHPALSCSTPRREGDEMACRCGKRWPIGENHP